MRAAFADGRSAVPIIVLFAVRSAVFAALLVAGLAAPACARAQAEDAAPLAVVRDARVADVLAARLAEFERLAERDPARAEPLLASLLAAAASLAPAQRVRLAVARAELASHQWRLSDALALSESALHEAEAYGDLPAVSRMLTMRAEVLGQFDRTAEGIAVSDAAVAVAERSGDLRARLTAFLTRADLHARLSDFQPAFAWHERAEIVARDLATHDARARVASSRGFLARMIGDSTGSAPALREAYEQFTADGNPILAVDHLRDYGVALFHLERLNEARDVLAESIARYVELVDPGGRGIALTWLAKTQARLGNLPQALASNAAALALLEGDDLTALRMVALTDRMDMQVQAGDLAAAQATLRGLVPLAERTSDPGRMRHFRRIEAAVLAAAGRHREAYAALQAYTRMQQEHDAQRLSHQLAAQLGRLETQRLQRDLQVAHREAELNQVALSERTHASRLQWTLAALAGLGLLFAMLRLWHRAQRHALLAATDALTGLPNRRALFDTGQQLFARCAGDGQPLAAVMLDLDFFKLVNDAHGHAAGDRALRVVADTLQRALREDDHLARYGGEEFAVLLPGRDDAQAYAIAERLRTAVADLLPGQTQVEQRLTTSVGYAVSHGQDRDFAALLRRADAALLRAKSGGRNRIMRAAAPADGPATATQRRTDITIS